jgi:hypothetical protein
LPSDTTVHGDVIGVGIHTGNARRGYELGTLARARGAVVIFGGIHATLDPDEALSLGGAHAVVKGDGDVIWPLVLGNATRSTLKPSMRPDVSMPIDSSPRAGSCCLKDATCNTGIATDGARVCRANRWARLIARPCRHLFTARPLAEL